MRLLLLVSAGAVAGGLFGCILKTDGVPGSGPADQERKFPDAASLQPDAVPYTAARLILAGTPVNVKLSRKQEGADISFDLKAQNEVLEVEHYVSDEHGFLFAGISDETFEPPLPIVRYPFTVGEAWEWSGEAALGKNRKSAKAAMTSTWETVNLAGGVYNCVVVHANLVVTAEGTDSKRTLKFWIQPKKGIVKREFGFSSTREPKPSSGS